MRKLGLLLAIAVVAILLFWLIAPKQEFASHQATDFDSFLSAVTLEESIPGLAIAVHDLALLTLSILNDGKYDGGELLSAGSFEEMLELQLPASVDDRQRFFWRDRYGLTGHAGSDRGVFTSLYFDKSKGEAIIVLMNRTPDGDTETAMERIFERASSDLLQR
jgi:hypothetical protein